MNTCQFCEKCNGVTGRNQPGPDLKYDGKIKYGVRSYAHFECYLDHKTIEDFKALGAFKIGQFPVFLLKERGLLQIAKEIRRSSNDR